jgi:signal transduction histidine kinase
MLGRQQIAGVPTAISELFKNAHDAYANRVEVDYYRWNRLFILRDDGIGMTREDFEGRWLTLGTDSKIGANLIQPPLSRGTFRPTMGEKGIGRLAIGAIGPQVLVMTRAEHFGQECPLVVSFINWSAFSIPGLNLDEIDIPIIECKGSYPSKAEISALTDQFANSIRRAKTKYRTEHFDQVLNEISQFDVDVESLSKVLGEPSFSGDGTGTHFYIHPASEQLEAALDDRAARSGHGNTVAATGNLEKFLIGFSNTMTHGHAEPVLRAAFRDHRHQDSYEDLIDPSRFWTQEDVQDADHWIRGGFNDFGQFQGAISVFGEEQPEHIIPYPEAKGKKLSCGPFSIEVAVMQGRLSESKATPEKFAAYQQKLGQFSGVYVYRDNLRVLPYGNNDFDWLDIEKRRTKSAGYYFFSYRNMFGAILLTREFNAELIEKAGREGFQENKAYRQFRDLLANFFVQIAADFFREDAVITSRADEVRKEFRRLFEAKKKRDGKVGEQRKQLAGELDAFFSSTPKESAEDKAVHLKKQIQAAIDSATSILDKDRAAEALISAELEARKLIGSLKEEFTVAKKRGLVLKGRLQTNFERYEAEFETIHESVINPLSIFVSQTVTDAAKRCSIDLDQRRRIESAIARAGEDANARIRDLANSIDRLAQTRVREIRSIKEEYLLQFAVTAREVSARLASTDFSKLSEEEIVEAKEALESRIQQIQEEVQSTFQDIVGSLEQIEFTKSDSGGITSPEALREALEMQIASLEDQVDADVEVTQMGMAIDVINHEFESSVKAIRENLRRLRSWGDVNPKLGIVYRDLAASFQHLDSYLKLFTPMHRRMYREPIEILGKDIFTYLRDVFLRKSEETGVEIKATRRFLTHSIHGYPSTFYPVFVNLVDNAVFWTKDVHGRREVLLDVDSDIMVISDTGPGVPLRDHERIFERGFSRKPMGRGLGLYICRQALAEAGFILELVERQGEKGASFRIRSIGEEL